MRKELLFTVFVSVAFIFLQAFWIVRMYQRYEEQYTEQVNKAFLDAIGKEVELRIRYVEEFKTPILIKPTGCVSEKERTGYKGDTIDLALLKQNDIVRNVSEFPYHPFSRSHPNCPVAVPPFQQQCLFSAFPLLAESCLPAPEKSCTTLSKG